MHDLAMTAGTLLFSLWILAMTYAVVWVAAQAWFSVKREHTQKVLRQLEKEEA